MVKKSSGLLNIKQKSDKLKSEIVKKEDEKVEGTTLSPALYINENVLDGNFQLTQDTELNGFFIRKAVELYVIEGTARIEKGRIFQEVFDEISGKNQYDEGLYEKWLLEVNENRRTARRYRYRYQVYSMMQSDAGKSLAAVIGTSMIESILKKEPEEQRRLIEKMENGIDKSDLKKLLLPEKDIVEKIENQNHSTPFYKSVFTFEKKIDKMTASEAHTALKEVEEIEEQLKEYKKRLKAKEIEN